MAACLGPLGVGAFFAAVSFPWGEDGGDELAVVDPWGVGVGVGDRLAVVDPWGVGVDDRLAVVDPWGVGVDDRLAVVDPAWGVGVDDRSLWEVPKLGDEALIDASLGGRDSGSAVV